MENNELYHYGRKGMKWGQSIFGSKKSSSAKRTSAVKTVDPDKKIKSINNRTKTKLKKIKENARAQAKIDKAQEKANAKIAKVEARYKKPAKTTNDTPAKKKSIKDMSSEEIRSRVERLRLEQSYKELLASTAPPKTDKRVSRGKKLVADILENSARNVGTQLTTYVMSAATNKIFGGIFKDDKIVDPRKGK